MSFGSRASRHDDIARPILDKKLEKHNSKTIDHGIETNKELSSILGPINTDSSRWMRHKPDYAIIIPPNNVMYVDLKSEGGTYQNFSIEAWPHAIMTAKYTDAFIVGVDIRTEFVGIIPVKYIPEPKQVFFPEDSDAPDNKKLLKKYFPRADFVDKDPPRYNASGTPYVLLPKNIFLDIDIFIERYILPHPETESKPKISIMVGGGLFGDF